MQFDNISFSGGFSIVPPPLVVPGQEAYTTAGTYSWTVPAGVTSVSAVCIGSGASVPAGEATSATHGGCLRYINSLSVTPGETLTVVVGTVGNSVGGGSKIDRGSNTLVRAAGGWELRSGNPSTTIGAGPYGGTVGGGNGGMANVVYHRTGGGGAGGYSGNGGDAGIWVSGPDGYGKDGSGGGGGGGGAGVSGGGSGGGVGIYGEGSNGVGGLGGDNGGYVWGLAGTGGSGGGNGETSTNSYIAKGGLYGGGAGGRGALGASGGDGGGGAVRIIWGDNRAFPSTNTTDQ